MQIGMKLLKIIIILKLLEKLLKSSLINKFKSSLFN